MTLAEAIAAVEKADQDLGGAQSAQAAAQAKFDVAYAAKASADEVAATDVLAFNGSLDALIAAAQSAKLEVLPK